MNEDNQVAIFIDFENIELSCRDKLAQNEDLDWSLVLDTAVSFGRVVMRRVYADWHYYYQNTRELLGLGIDLVHVTSRSGKNAADIRIVIDVMELLLGKHQHISHVVLVSGDGDFTELVHRLRAHGKTVVGLGVSESSAEYLINACDQFIFYDLLLRGLDGEEGEQRTSEVGTAVAFDISEGRQLLRRALAGREEEWVTGGQVKESMLRLAPAFNERNYNFDSFKTFLEDQADMVRIKTDEEGGHLEVQLIPFHEVQDSQQAPEAQLDYYLQLLSENKVRMTPTEYRPRIIMKFFELTEEYPYSSLTALKEKLHTHFEENAPNVKGQYVHETIHQLFRTYCFDFDPDDSKYSSNTRLWDREVSLTDDITSKSALLTKCDRNLLRKIGQHLPSFDDLDREAAARLLYGSVKGQRMLDHVEKLIEDLKRRN